jgi:hypothetical protein
MGALFGFKSTHADLGLAVLLLLLLLEVLFPDGSLSCHSSSRGNSCDANGDSVFGTALTGVAVEPTELLV